MITNFNKLPTSYQLMNFQYHANGCTYKTSFECIPDSIMSQLKSLLPKFCGVQPKTTVLSEPEHKKFSINDLYKKFGIEEYNTSLSKINKDMLSVMSN